RRQQQDGHDLSDAALVGSQGTIRNGALSRVARTKAPASVAGASFTCAHSTTRSCASSVTASAGTVQTKACCFGPDVAPTYCQLCPWSRESCTSTKRTSPFTRFRQAILRPLPAGPFPRGGASRPIFGG